MYWLSEVEGTPFYDIEQKNGLTNQGIFKLNDAWVVGLNEMGYGLEGSYLVG
jgi:hypothetical protein